MSEFDREAERERLREKFAADEADRASAKHMSELLLQGATMTDRHCPECGTPLFREDGATFCPECERPVVEADRAEGDPRPAGADDRAAEPTATGPSEPAGGSPRADIEAALERAAAAAARADDPRQAREYLETARAAIEALRALEGDR